MDKAVLVAVEIDLEAGRRLISSLAASNVTVSAALWNLDVAAEQWHLMLASPLRDEAGPLETYETVLGHLRRLGMCQLTLGNVTVRSPREPLVQALRKTFADYEGEPGWLHGVSLHGVYIEHAYLYVAK